MILVILLALLIASFGGVLLVGAPYLPTLTPQVKTALELVDLKPGQTLIELGCGDGKVVVAAARKGIKVVAYELNPILVAVVWLRTRRYRKNVSLIWGDFWRRQWPPADAVFVFILPKYMDKLNKKLVQQAHKPVKLVSFAFAMSGKQADDEKNHVFMYIYS